MSGKRGFIGTAAAAILLAAGGLAGMSAASEHGASALRGDGAQQGKNLPNGGIDARTLAMIRAGMGGGGGIGRPKRRGWSVAEDRRRATKRRNQARHRASCRGKR